jgi:hypothetical protein
MNHSESIAKIAAALTAFQSEVKDPARDGENPHFRSKYVQLDGLLAAVRPILSKHGLSVMQSTGGDGQDISVTTEIMHTSGEWIRTDALILKAVKADPQGAGSAVTYGRRYSLSAALGVAWDDDDDGNAASAPPKSKVKAAPKATKNDHLKAVAEAAKKQHVKNDEIKEIMAEVYGKSTSAELTDEEAADFSKNFVAYAVQWMAKKSDDEKLMEDIPL